MKPYRFVMLIFALVLNVLSVFSQSQQSENEALERLWLNIPSAPLQFAVAPDAKSIVLKNDSVGTVLRYRIACVNQTNGKIKVVNTHPISSTWLPPADQDRSLTAADRFNLSNGVLKEACDGNLRLMIVEVEFEDGGIWKFKREKK